MTPMDHPRRKTPAKAAEVEAWLEGMSDRIVEQAQGEPGNPRAFRRRLWLVGAGLAAAAVVVLILAPFAKRTHTEPPGGIPMGTGSLRLLRPLTPTSAFDVFEWEGQPPAGGSAEIWLGAAGSDDPLVREPVTGSSWRPSLDLAARLPDDIWWAIHFRDRLGVTVDSKHGEATRARH
jgi:hypothetical protein